MQDNNGYTLTVTQLNEYVNGMLRRDRLLDGVSVRGEISGFKRHSSGHLYFSLKDEGALIRCAMFRQNAVTLDLLPQDGQSVTVSGSVALYVKDGQYQLYVSSIRREGEGELYRRFMLMKTRLEAEGLFDATHKRPLPALPRCIGIMTSPTGAAVQDMINITRRRFPKMNILLYPVRVQGEGAAEEIARAIAEMNRLARADVLIVGRGGGSLEDLWAFNEELVARAIYKSAIPVVSAVGHETDYTIADFVADLRAPTPSAAAELVTPEYDRLVEEVSAAADSVEYICKNALASTRRELEGIASSAAFAAVRHSAAMQRGELTAARTAARTAIREALAGAKNAVTGQASRMDALSPQSVLRRGYAMVQAQSGRYVTSAASLAAGAQARLVMHDGEAGITINEIRQR